MKRSEINNRQLLFEWKGTLALRSKPPTIAPDYDEREIDFVDETIY